MSNARERPRLPILPRMDKIPVSPIRSDHRSECRLLHSLTDRTDNPNGASPVMKAHANEGVCCWSSLISGQPH